MTANGKRMSLFGVAFLLLDLAVIGALFAASSSRRLQDSYELAQETMTFLEDSTDRYESVEQGYDAKSLQALTDTALAFSQFLPAQNVVVDDQLAQGFIRAEHIGGLIVLDGQLQPIAQADLDNKDAYSLWRNVLGKQAVHDVLSHADETYSDKVTLAKTDYNFTVIPYGDGVLLAYESLYKPSADPYNFSITDLLTNNSFHENPTVIMTRGSHVVSTNGHDLARSSVRALAASARSWDSDQLNRTTFQGGTYYGYRGSYKTYRFYILYAEGEVFSGRMAFVAIGFAIFLAICAAILVMRGVADKRRLRENRKQLRIIDAISATYESTFLLHLDTMVMEDIKMSHDMAGIFVAHPEPSDFLECVCRDVIAPESRGTALALMDVDTIEKRLENNIYLAEDIKSRGGVWYSLQVIPQQRDEDGKLLTVLVATRNIMAIKRAEELSFRDRLTGLHNRNYLESRIGELTDTDAMPLSLIMVDCDRLKQTNDTMGHEWGDRLLQRLAEALQECAGVTSSVIRIGGDEFLILCPHTDTGTAHVIMRDIELALAAASDDDLTLGASLGTATMRSADESFKATFEAADAAMYEQKQEHHRQQVTSV